VLPYFAVVTGDKVCTFDVVFIVSTHTSYDILFFLFLLLFLYFVSLLRGFCLSSSLALLSCWFRL